MVGRTYDPGDRRTKHKLPLVERPTFERKDGALIGICPKGMTEAERKVLLDQAIEAPRSGKRIIVFNVHHGVVYMAESSDGRTFHGYPWRQRPGRPALPRRLRDQLRDRANESGHLAEFEAWMKEHGR